MQLIAEFCYILQGCYVQVCYLILKLTYFLPRTIMCVILEIELLNDVVQNKTNLFISYQYLRYS